MSGAQTSTFGNVLFNAPAAYEAAQHYQTNQLLQQEHQQGIAAGEMEAAGRIAGAVLSLDTPEQRAAAWPGMLAQARASGWKLANSPDTYPGDAVVQTVLRMATPSQTQAEWQANIAANKAISAANAQPVAAAPGTSTAPSGSARPLTGDLETDRKIISQRESGGDPTALNYVAVADPTAYGRGATASGKYQFVNSTWREGLQLAGIDPAQYPTAMSAPESVQDKVFTAVYGKYGTKPWDPSTYGQTWASAPGGRMVLVKGTMAPATTAAAPGGQQVAPSVTMGQVGDQTVPPPPWGAPGAYPVYGGGMGAVIGGQPAAVSGTPIPAGRPTGPPVITDQPAGGGVVAGPPGVATVGQPVPASPAVAGNVDAINAGIVARGGQPVTDPNATPTPARYAGTTPAPSVEAAPQPGWGTGIGSGYGPQNTLAPPSPPPAQPARPVATAPPPAAQPAPAGNPPPPQLQPLLPNGLTARQQAILDAQGATGRMTGQQRLAAEQAYQNQNIQLQQKAFSDWIQVQQLQTSQGQLSVSQQEVALKYWQNAHPDAKVTLSGGEIITQDPRDGHEIAPRIKVTPNEAPRTVDGTAIAENGQWRQPRPGEQGVPGKWTVGPAGGQFFPEATSPAQAGYKVNERAYERNSGQINGIADKGEAAQADQVRIKEMQDQLDRIVTGPGTATKVNMTAWLQRWLPNAVNPFTQQTQGLTDAAAAEVFNKLAFRNATTQERSVAGSRGAGARMTEMFLQSNPGLELLTDANQRMLNVMRIANQADIDKTQGAQDHFVTNERAFRDSNGKTYTSLEDFNANWQRQRNPEVFAAAASAAAGLPALDGEVNGVKFKGWATELSAAEEKRVLEIVARAAPGTRVNTKGGDIIARPQAPATPPMPPGYQVVR